MGVHAHVCSYVWRWEVDIWCVPLLFSVLNIETGSHVAYPVCSENAPSLSLGDRITDRVPHSALTLVLGSELWSWCLHGQWFLYWAISLLHRILSAVLLIISWRMYGAGSDFRATELPLVLFVLMAVQPDRRFSVYLSPKLITSEMWLPSWSLPRNGKP